MHIEHMAIYTNHLEQMKAFFEHYFEAKAGNKYTNPAKGFESYFLSFASGARLELMCKSGIQYHSGNAADPHIGYAHISFACGSKDKVARLTGQLSQDGFQVIDGPRTTSDGYFESVVLDPDGNTIEITG